MKYEICTMETNTEMDEKGYVHWKSWQETYQELMPKKYLDNLTLEKCVKMAHKCPQNTTLLKVEEKTVGFSCVAKASDKNPVNELVAIYLLREYHGKKLGYELLKNTLSSLDNHSPVVLWVLKGNDRAIRFYQKFGFSLNGIERICPFGVELQMEWKPI